MSRKVETKFEEPGPASEVRFRETELISRRREEVTKSIGKSLLMAFDELLHGACGRSEVLTSSKSQSPHGEQ